MNNLRHGDSHTRFHDLWRDMRGRCSIPTKTSYKNYGARGISVCNEWEVYEKFKSDMHKSYLKHVKMFGEKQTTLDRINVDGNYSKENCRWATYKKQMNNTRRNHKITIGKKTKTMQEWSELYKISHDRVEVRINKLKWDPEKALKTPIRKTKKYGN